MNLKELFKKLLKPTKNKRIAFFLFFDLIIIILSFYLSFYLRFEFTFPRNYLVASYNWIVGLIFFKIIVLILCGLYNINWRFVGLTELKNLVKSFIIVFASMYIGNLILRRYLPFYDIPRSVVIMDSFISFGLISMLRISKRLYRELFYRKVNKNSTLIIGANINTENIIKQSKSLNAPYMNVFAIIDKDKKKIGTKIAGIPVFGFEKLKNIVWVENIDSALINLPEASHKEIKEVFDTLNSLNIKNIKIVPKVDEYRTKVNLIKTIKDINISDLLFRETVEIDYEKIKSKIEHKTVLVTGAGGSIGSEIFRRLIYFGVKKVVGFEIDETEIFNLNYEISKIKDNKQKVDFVVGDVRDKEKLNKVFSKYKPDIVFHASAYKHVPLMDRFPEESISTNIFGTLNLAEISAENKVERFINISTDKAVNPTSIMGVTKRIGEIICSSINRGNTKYISVRFGNVLGSRGSVITLFIKQIQDGGPVTVTHPEMERYFMSISEAVLLVFQAAYLGKGGEVFVLDMGEPVEILELAEKLIEINNLKPYEDIDIIYSGIRPGEKLHEEILTAEEGTDVTKHRKIFVARNETQYSWEKLSKTLNKINKNAFDRAKVVKLMKELVPYFKPQNGKKRRKI